MDIADIITTDFTTVAPETQISKIVGKFQNTQEKGVVVAGDTVKGVITRRQLSTSHYQPKTTAKTLVRSVPEVDPDEDIRRVAKLMLDSDSHLLPVIENENLVGVVTIEAILDKVKSSMDAVTVADVYTDELLSIDQSTTVGEVIHYMRENRITHLPVLEDTDAVGILSMYDVARVMVREEHRQQGGDVSGMDPYGGALAKSSGRVRTGGFGSRAGDAERILDLPVRDLMISPVRSISLEASLSNAIEEMESIESSSLVVEDNGVTQGIITKADILAALTWEADATRPVQIYGIELIDDISYESIVAMIDQFEERNQRLTIFDAKLHLHEHDESLRGVPLLLAKIRLFTDEGLVMASGEGYGAKHAINEARKTLERRLRDEKTPRRRERRSEKSFWDRRFGWVLEA